MNVFREHKQQTLERIRANDPRLSHVFLEDATARDIDAFIAAMQGPPANTYVTSIKIRGLPRAKSLDDTLARGAPMDDESAVKLAHLLSSNHHITEFCMDENHMGPKGIAAFLKALRANPNIVSFSPVNAMANEQEKLALRRLLILKNNEHREDPKAVPDALLLEGGSTNIINLGKLADTMPDLQRKCILNEAVARNLISLLINQHELDRGENGLVADEGRFSPRRPLGYTANVQTNVQTVAANNVFFKERCRQAGISQLQDPENWLWSQTPHEQNIEGLALEIQARLPSIIYVAEEKLHIGRTEMGKMLVEMRERAEKAGVTLTIPDYVLAALGQEKAGGGAGERSMLARHERSGRSNPSERQ